MATESQDDTGMKPRRSPTLKTTAAQELVSGLRRIRTYFDACTYGIGPHTSSEELRDVLLAWGWWLERIQELRATQAKIAVMVEERVLAWLRKNEEGIHHVDVGDLRWYGTEGSVTEKVRDRAAAAEVLMLLGEALAERALSRQTGADFLLDHLRSDPFKPATVGATIGEANRRRLFERRVPDKLKAGETGRKLTAADKRFLETVAQQYERDLQMLPKIDKE